MSSRTQSNDLAEKNRKSFDAQNAFPPPVAALDMDGLRGMAIDAAKSVREVGMYEYR